MPLMQQARPRPTTRPHTNPRSLVPTRQAGCVGDYVESILYKLP